MKKIVMLSLLAAFIGILPCPGRAVDTVSVRVEEINSGTGPEGSVPCTFGYTLSMIFEGKLTAEGAPLTGRILHPPKEVLAASGGGIPKKVLELRPVESSMKVINWTNTDEQNNAAPLPRFPKGPGGMGISDNSVIGWHVGDSLYLAYGFVGNGIYGYFADWDSDEEISRTSPQPMGCRPWTGGDNDVYMVDFKQVQAGKPFTVTREFDSTDGDVWKSHTTLTITFSFE